MRFIRRHGFLIAISTGGIILLIVIPISISILANKAIFAGTAGQFNSWLGFWGSYFGGVISGLLTLGGVYLGLRHERNYSLFTRYYTNTRQYEEFISWVENMKRIVSYTDFNKDNLDHVKKAMNKDGVEKVIEGISRVDLELYQLGKDIEYSLGWISLSIEQLKSNDEINRNYAKKGILEEVEVVKAKAREVERRDQVITKNVNKYR